jgi:hypothetical protein
MMYSEQHEVETKTRCADMKIRFWSILAAALALTIAAPAVAHHSFAAQYDRSKPTTITGVVTKIDWINPHARFFVDVKDSSGQMVNWEVELGPPAGLMRRGWTRNSLKVGESVTVNGYLAKDGSNLANASTVTLGDGRKVFAGSSADGETNQ